MHPNAAQAPSPDLVRVAARAEKDRAAAVSLAAGGVAAAAVLATWWLTGTPVWSGGNSVVTPGGTVPYPTDPSSPEIVPAAGAGGSVHACALD